MCDPKEYYKVLELTPKASKDEIKKQYRKLSLLYHPDRQKNGTSNNTNNTMFHKISEAYETLSNEKSKCLYDGGCSDNNVSNFDIHTRDIFDIFKNMQFGDGKGQFFNMDGVSMNFGEYQRPTPIIKTIEITIQQAFTGCKIPINIERWVCQDSIKTKEKETIYVSLPKGVDENEIIILQEKGNVISESNKGHIKVFVKVVNNTSLLRKGLDLYCQKRISLKDALCGFSFEIDHVDGRQFKIENRNGNVICPSYKRFIPNLGMERDGSKGNLVIEFTVLFPEKLNKEQIEGIKAIL